MISIHDRVGVASNYPRYVDEDRTTDLVSTCVIVLKELLACVTVFPFFSAMLTVMVWIGWLLFNLSHCDYTSIVVVRRVSVS